MPPPLTDEERTALRGNLMTLRIIVFALLSGVMCFAAYSVYARLDPGLAQANAGFAQPMSVLQIVALGFGVAAAVLSFIVPPFVPAPQVETQKTDPRAIAIDAAAGVVQMRTIIAAALLEGAAFFNAFLVFTEGSYSNLAMVGLLLLLILMHFPLAGSYYNRVERALGVDPFASKWGRDPN